MPRRRRGLGANWRRRCRPIRGPRLADMQISAQSATFYEPDAAHPNRLKFDGVLVPLDRVSDAAPNGSHGRRIVLTRAAAQRALPSLQGMGVNLSVGWDKHSVTDKIG